MSSPALISLLIVVFAGSCMAEYLGLRVANSLPAKRRKWLAAVLLLVCGSALGAFRKSAVVTDYSVLLAALILGTLLSRLIRSFRALAILLIVGAIADLVSFYAGSLLVQAQHNPHAAATLRYLVVSVWIKREMFAVIGVTDLIFFTTCVCVTQRLGWPEPWPLITPLVGLLSALGVGLVVGPTPALPFLAAAVLLFGYGSRPFRQSWARMGRGP